VLYLELIMLFTADYLYRFATETNEFFCFHLLFCRFFPNHISFSKKIITFVL